LGNAGRILQENRNIKMDWMNLDFATMWSWIFLLLVHVANTAWQDGLPIPIAIRRGEKIIILPGHLFRKWFS